MKLLMLYRPNSSHARMAEAFVNEFTKQHTGRRLELLNIDTRDGSSTATLYEVMQYPAILALADDGQLLRDWQGGSFPLMNEIAYYAHT